MNALQKKAYSFFFFLPDDNASKTGNAVPERWQEHDSVHLLRPKAAKAGKDLTISVLNV